MAPHPRTLRRLLGLAVSAVVAASALTLLPLAAPAASAEPVANAVGTTYYVDAETGDDGAAGSSPDAAWRSLDRVNAETFAPGDQVLLRSGQSWTGQLWPKGSGTPEAPITIGRFGTGDKPAVQGAGQVGDAVRLFNQQHWVIRDLDVSNTRTGGATVADNLADLRGIHVSGDNSTTLSGFTITGVDVHDVTGEVNWIGGSVEGNAPGIRFKTGWDGSKKTGGIIFDTTVPDIHNPPTTPTILNDVLIADSTVINTSFAGIVVKQYTGDGTNEAGEVIATPTGWGTRTNATDPKFAPHTNFTIRGNYIRQDGTAYGCNGMYLTNLRGGLVEHNVVHRTGTSGIETYFADDVVIQYNEVYETQKKAGGADSNGIDPDKGTTKMLIQYNYVHGNGDGVLICQFSFGDTVVRYNVIAENTRYPIYLHSDRAATVKIHNNTIFNTVSNYLIYGYGSSLNATYDIRDNVIHSTRAHATLTTSPTITYANNLYSGAELTVPVTDTAALVGDAGFVDTAISGPYGTPATGPQLGLAHGYATVAGSKAVNTAGPLADRGELDFAGNSVPVGTPDVGAFEYRTAADATTEAVSGFVRDTTGRALGSAAVTVVSGSVTRTATTDATGWFRATGVPFGEAQVTATRNGYEGDAVTVPVGEGTSAITSVVLASTSNVGAVSGRVLDVTGAPLAGAAVEVRSGASVLASTTSDVSGAYALGEVAIGEGHSVHASAGELRPASVGGIRVDPGSTTEVRAILLEPQEPSAIHLDDVEARATGVFSSVDGYTVSRSGGSVDVVQLDTTKAFKLTRTTNSGSTTLGRTPASPLTGIVTIESRVMRNDPTTSAANWFSVPYLYGTNGVQAVSLAFSKGKIIAYQGTQSTELQSYELGRWYTLTTIVDTVNQRFDLLIDGQRVLDDATFRNPLVGGIARIDYYANSSNYGSVHIDDLRILQGSERDRADASLSSVSTDAGTPVAVGADLWRLDVAAGVESVQVTASPASATATTLTIAGVEVAPGVASEPIALAEGTNGIPIVVTAENGTQRTHTLEIERGLLAADATLSGLAADRGELAPGFDPSVEEYVLSLPAGASRVALTPTATGPSSSITIDGAAVGSGSAHEVEVADGGSVVIDVDSADGTARVSYTLAIDVAAPIDASAPASAKLSNTSGWATGLHDGNYEVRMNLWWGVNAREFRLFENGVLIETVPLTPDGLNAQQATVAISGRVNGEYTYTGELVNTAGVTATTSTTVQVTQAAPGKVALRASGSGDSRTLITDLWWGTNATEYRLFHNGVLVDTQALVAATPGAQHAETLVSGLAPGRHEFESVLVNHAGESRSGVVVVTIR